jgi:hypothetical protein
MICKNCNVNFIRPKNSKKLYCSDRCRDTYNLARSNEYVRNKNGYFKAYTIKDNCAICNKEYMKPNIKSKTCSTECKAEYRRLQIEASIKRRRESIQNSMKNRVVNRVRLKPVKDKEVVLSRVLGSSVATGLKATIKNFTGDTINQKRIKVKRVDGLTRTLMASYITCSQLDKTIRVCEDKYYEAYNSQYKQTLSSLLRYRKMLFEE